jgi:CRP/FNR family transcriptional regulator, cyclic AMP receptor protein
MSVVTSIAAGAPSLYLREDETQAAAPDLLARLTPTERQRLTAASTLMRFRAGQSVFRQGEAHTGMFVIVSGEVRTFYTGPSGREITLAYWSAGNFVGGPAVFGGGAHVWSGDAMRATQALHVRGPELRRLMAQSPNLALALVEALEHKGRCYSEMIHMLGTRSASERLAQMLLLLAERDGRKTARGVAISRTLTYDDLAKMVGATRQWVTTTLERLAEQGMIDSNRKRIVIIDAARLRRFAGCAEAPGQIATQVAGRDAGQIARTPRRGAERAEIPSMRGL